MERLLQPKDALEVVEFGPGHLSDYGRTLLRQVPPPGVSDAAARYMGLQMASFSKHYEKVVLEHVTGKATLALVTPVYMALCTVVPTVSSTGSTITEAAYTGYARKSVAASTFSAAVEGEPSSITNGEAITFAACTAGSSTIIGWALCDASTVGNIIVWGTCASTVISSTQTPATCSIGGLVVSLV